MKSKFLLLLIILILPISLYILFKDRIQTYWEDFDTMFTIVTYSTSVVLFLYTANLKFHFAINKILSWFRHDHTIWMYSYSVEIDNKFNDTLLLEELTKLNIKINKHFNDQIEFIYNDSQLYRFQINTLGDVPTLHLFSNKIIVPSKRVNSTIHEIIELTETVEDSINHDKQSRKFDLTIEYPGSSPFYTYWVKKLPEQNIFNFNFSISVPSNKNIVKVNKNQILISSKSISTLFETTRNYLSLQIEL